MAETPIPQNLSSELSKARTTPDVLKKAPIHWERVKKVDAALDKIPDIYKLGGKVTTDSEQIDANDIRKGTKIKVGNEQETNLVDYVLQDEQIRVMLQEGMRLNILSEQDIVNMGIDYKNFQKGDKAGLKMPALDRLQKSETMALILNRLAESSPRTATLYLTRASELMLDPKKIELLNEKGTFTNKTLINALAAGGREELSKYIVEAGYQPHAIQEKDLRERRILAKLVKEGYGDEGITQFLSEQTPYFFDKEGARAIEYSATMDLVVAQAMTNAMVPAEVHLAIDRLEQSIAQAPTVAEKEEMRHELTRTKQKVYAALLNAKGVHGYEKDGEIFQKVGLGVDDQNDILRLSALIKESSVFKEAENVSIFDANRQNLVQVAAEITGANHGRMKGIVKALPIEQEIEALREKYEGTITGEMALENFVRGEFADNFLDVVRTNLRPGARLSAGQKDQLRRFFLKTFDTERSLMKKAHTRFKDVERPTEIKIGSKDAVEQGIKGLDLLFRRSITEQQYDWETYKKLVIEGAAEVKTQPPGAVLEQGLEKTKADEDSAKAAEEAYAEDKSRQEAKEAEEANTKAAAEAEEKAQQELREFQDRKPSVSVKIENIVDIGQSEVYKNELLQKIDQGLVTSEDIQDEMSSMLNIPKGFEGLVRSPVRWIKELGLKKDAAKYENYKKLKEAFGLARQLDAIPNEDQAGLEELRGHFFVAHKEEVKAKEEKKKEEEEGKEENPVTDSDKMQGVQ